MSPCSPGGGDAQVSHRGENAPDGFDRFLSLLYTVDTLDSLKLDIEPLLAAMLSRCRAPHLRCH